MSLLVRGWRGLKLQVDFSGRNLTDGANRSRHYRNLLPNNALTILQLRRFVKHPRERPFDLTDAEKANNPTDLSLV